MNRCPNCAAQNRVGAKFCTSCGFRLPVDEPASVQSNDRSPFATTSTLPWSSNSSDPAPLGNDDETGFAGWNSDAPSPSSDSDVGPGLSWDATPPVDRAVPVSDEMIASLISEAPPESTVDDSTEIIAPGEPAAEADSIAEPAPEPHSEPTTDDLPDVESFAAEDVAYTSADTAAVVTSATGPADTRGATIDGLLRMARDLEYGLIELADAQPAFATVSEYGQADTGLLSGALAGLQSEEELAALRSAIATAQERPRDVDVMLDLVLRADAMAAIIGERDQLKSAIELALRDSPVSEQSDNGDQPAEVSGDDEE